MRKCKKTQQETVGFVMIILIVMILGVIFLGISLRNKSQPVFVEDAELTNFLSASLSYTTECYKDHDSDFKSLEELVRYCYSQTSVSCLNGKNSCQVVNETYLEMIEIYKPAGVLSYSKIIFSYNSSTEERAFLEISTGTMINCPNKRAGRQTIDAGNGIIRAELEICLK